MSINQKVRVTLEGKAAFEHLRYVFPDILHRDKFIVEIELIDIFP